MNRAVLLILAAALLAMATSHVTMAQTLQHPDPQHVCWMRGSERKCIPTAIPAGMLGRFYPVTHGKPDPRDAPLPYGHPVPPLGITLDECWERPYPCWAAPNR
jgi:hypothetical protein